MLCEQLGLPFGALETAWTSIWCFVSSLDLHLVLWEQLGPPPVRGDGRLVLLKTNSDPDLLKPKEGTPLCRQNTIPAGWTSYLPLTPAWTASEDTCPENIFSTFDANRQEIRPGNLTLRANRPAPFRQTSPLQTNRPAPSRQTDQPPQDKQTSPLQTNRPAPSRQTDQPPPDKQISQ